MTEHSGCTKDKNVNDTPPIKKLFFLTFLVIYCYYNVICFLRQKKLVQKSW